MDNPERTYEEDDFEPFIGQAEQTLDSVNRVFIPVSFQDNLKEDFYLCKGVNEPCIWILPSEVFKSMLRKSRKRIPLTNRNHQRWIARITADAVKKSLDKQNRITLPPQLLKHAEITPKSKVKLVGHDERAEIWSLDNWHQVESDDFFELSEEIDQKYQITGFEEE